MLTLVLGGARSGKSRYAQKRAAELAANVIYIATATADDEEMQQRIERHRLDRPKHWRTVEAPLKLAAALKEHATENHCILVDCLTLWLTNVLFDQQGRIQKTRFRKESEALFNALPSVPAHVILVSNEVGTGVIPIDGMSRRFVDEAGLLHQQLAKISDRVVLVTAGIAQILK